nr:hypothetical protein [Tanacetum cinerariifolium]
SLISFLGAIMVVGYCTILWIFFVAKGRVANTVYNPSEGTMPSTSIRPSSELMWKGVITSYVIIALCFFPLQLLDIGHSVIRFQLTEDC